MKNILKSIRLRAKKWIIFLTILPLLTGVIAFIMEKRTPQMYTAQTTIELGNFENERLTDPKMVANLLKSTKFLEKLQKQSKSKFNVSDVKSKISVTPSETKLVQIQFTGSSKESAKGTLDSLVNSFIDESMSLYQKKYNLAQSLLRDTKNIKTDVENVKKEETILDLEKTLIDYRKTQLMEPVQVSGSYVSPVKRGIFGFILGIMLDVVLLVFPELFREYR